MKLFGKPNDMELDPSLPDINIDDAKERLNLFSDCIRALFFFVYEYTLDIPEIQAEKFKRKLIKLQEEFQANEKTQTLSSRFNRQKEKIVHHIHRQKTYLDERETEYKEIIDLMSAAMSTLDNENHHFYKDIQSQGERFENLTLLDDLKRMKTELLHEVENMRLIVRQKETMDQKRVDALSNQVVGLKEELERTRQTARTDGLTGVNNRKSLDDYLRRMVERNSVTKTPFSLLMMDLDDFKKMNDKYGHTVGDRTLMAFANKCRSSVRSDDFLARYGGEEFTLILPGASLRNAMKKAKQLCKTVATTRYAADDSSKPDILTVTVSIGVGTYRKGDTVKSLIDRADRCLYKAKEDGKNRAISENML